MVPTPSGAVTASPTPSLAGETQESLPSVSGRLEPPPACPGARVRTTAVGPYRSVVGSEPVWAGVYAELDRAASVFVAHDAPRTEYGWRVKVLWVMRPDATGTVTAVGRPAEGGQTLWFELAGDEPTTSLLLDPAQPETRDEGWLNFPSYAYFPAAGCYELRASSERGTWSVIFGLGG
jgi:hypothetical protein